jgi:hypothetical protein
MKTNNEKANKSFTTDQRPLITLFYICERDMRNKVTSYKAHFNFFDRLFLHLLTIEAQSINFMLAVNIEFISRSRYFHSNTLKCSEQSFST